MGEYIKYLIFAGVVTINVKMITSWLISRRNNKNGKGNPNGIVKKLDAMVVQENIIEDIVRENNNNTKDCKILLGKIADNTTAIKTMLGMRNA